MQLTQEQFDVLAHVVVDPQVWADHAESTLGTFAILEKVERYRDSYLSEKDSPDYKTRAQRDAVLRADLVKL